MIDIILFGNYFQQNRGSLIIYAKGFLDLIRGEYESVLTITNFHFQKNTPYMGVPMSHIVLQCHGGSTLKNAQ